MKPFHKFLLGISIIALIIYAVPAYRQKATQLLSYSECDTPLQYKIGSIDPRFGLSETKILEDANAATDIWSSAEGKKLFAYSQNASLTVNFIYDKRQALDTAINQLDTKLNQSNKVLQQQIDDYQARVASFEQKIAEFKKTVQKYNKEGGAPPDVYNDLIAQQKQLQTEGDALNAQARQLNLSTNDYNANVSVLNQNVSQFNIALSQKPEEGIYDGGNNTIDIYFVNSHQELLRTLAHEFGHALGMNHVSNPTAIMYPYTTNSITVTSDDMQQLSYVCRKQSAFAHWLDKFFGWFALQTQSLLEVFAPNLLK